MDFDHTMTRKDFRSIAEHLISQGYEVWIVTSRCDTEFANSKGWHWVDKSNHKLLRVADDIGINHKHIIFTNFINKIIFLEGNDFVFHLDDDVDELIEIQKSKDNCKPINVEHMDWERDCREVLTK